MSGIAASTACQSLHMNCVHLDFRGPSPAQRLEAREGPVPCSDGGNFLLCCNMAFDEATLAVYDKGDARCCR